MVCVIVSALAASTPALPAPGDLDFTFGQGGRVIVDIENDDDLPAGLVLQPDGRIVVGRGNTNETDDFSVLRFLAEGSPDTSFDADGRTSLNIPEMRCTTQAVLLQPDGKVIAAGWARDTRATTRLGLVRYLANGSLDTSFGNGGLVVSDAQFDGSNLSVILQPDGRLVAAGHVNQAGPNRRVAALARFEANGSLDLSFGQSGYAYSGGATTEWMTQLARQPDGKLLVFTDVSAPVTPNWYDWHPEIMRFHPDGSPDLGFGASGRASLMDATSFLAALIQTDGKILLTVASDPYYWDISYCGAAIARTHSDGRLDDSFGTNGVSSVPLDGCQTLGTDILIEPDGKLVVNGARPAAHPGAGIIDSNDYALTRLNPAGTLDATFGNAGQAVLDVGDGPYPPYVSLVGGLARQADGKLVVLTSGMRALTSFGNNSRIVLARLLPSGNSPGLIGIKGVDPQAASGRITLRIRRSGGSEGSVSVDYGTNASSAPAKGTITWGDGDREDKSIAFDVSTGSFLSLSNVTGGAGLATRHISIPYIPPQSPAPAPAAPAGSAAGGGGAMSWDFLLTTALGFLGLTWRSRRVAASQLLARTGQGRLS
jgi:uncharacterized delta-60 repeat protein